MTDILVPLIGWVGAVCLTWIIGWTTKEVFILYFEDRKKQRLERFDLFLQQPGAQTLEEIARIAKRERYSSLIGTKVSALLLSKGLIEQEDVG